MAFQLLLIKKAEKALDNLPEKYRLKMTQALQEIVRAPYSGKKLSGNKKEQYSVRVWPYRIIYKIENKLLIVVVIDIDQRKDVSRP